jgi:fluoride ion exporter CrcB/FEX
VRVLRIALGGAIGTAARLLAGGLALSATPPGPLRLLAVNVLGAALLGWALSRRPLPEAWMPALTVGVLGGFTTFSTMVVQAGTLGHDAGPGARRARARDARGRRGGRLAGTLRIAHHVLGVDPSPGAVFAVLLTAVPARVRAARLSGRSAPDAHHSCSSDSCRCSRS